ncbi:hypothetical protein CYY_009826 [Polysphondylium violaceum]|uniref:Reverse transcriptase domain-containing protein n=1 Tax=Polysphondylium violaceum TaxID=133409 RepID=A0A8J4UP85_9MYCE|nr:hypothetical protein CYY_009826 [Polysphondylium violaceum]
MEILKDKTKSPDIIALQEIKSTKIDLTKLERITKDQYNVFSSLSPVANKAGVSTLVKKSIQHASIKAMDDEGRLVAIQLHLPNMPKDFIHVNIYAPVDNNAKKKFWENDLPTFISKLHNNVNRTPIIIISGDMNNTLTGNDKLHMDTDHPVRQAHNPGGTEHYHNFLRAAGYVDIFRELHPDKYEFTRTDWPNNSLSRLDTHLSRNLDTNLVYNIGSNVINWIVSDHSMVTMELNLKRAIFDHIPHRSRSRQEHDQKREILNTCTKEDFENFSITIEPSLKELWNATFENRPTPIPDINQLESIIKEFNKCLIQSGKKMLNWKTVGRKRETPISDEKLELLKVVNMATLANQIKQLLMNLKVKLHLLSTTEDAPTRTQLLNDYELYMRKLLSRFKSNKNTHQSMIEKTQTEIQRLNNTPIENLDHTLINTRIEASINAMNEDLIGIRRTRDNIKTAINRAIHKEWATRLQELGDKRDKGFYRLAKYNPALTANIQPQFLYVGNPDNPDTRTVIHCKEEILQETEKYFTNLLGESSYTIREPNQEPWHQEALEVLATPTLDSLAALQDTINLDEIKTAIQECSNGKATGTDEIYNEYLKHLPKVGLELLERILNGCKQLKKIPKQWKEGTIFTIYKDGSPNELKNYRGITLLSNIYKIYTSILNKRIHKYLDATNPLSETQFGFRETRSTITPLQVIGNIFSDARKFDKDIHVLYLDIAKAFDEVPHKGLIHALKLKRLPEEIIEILVDTLTDCTVKVITTKGLTKNIKIGKGIKQGCPLSPLLWNIFIDPTLHQINRRSLGYSIPDEPPQQISNLVFADDFAGIANTLAKLQEIADIFTDYLDFYGLKINVTKSAYTYNIRIQANNSNSNPNQTTYQIKYKNSTIPTKKKSESYKYLGAWINLELNWKDHKNYIERKFSATLKNLERKGLYPDQLTDCINSLIIPVITYGCPVVNYDNGTITKWTEQLAKAVKNAARFFNNTNLDIIYLNKENLGFGLFDLKKTLEHTTLHTILKALHLADQSYKTYVQLWDKLQFESELKDEIKYKNNLAVCLDGLKSTNTYAFFESLHENNLNIIFNADPLNIKSKANFVKFYDHKIKNARNKAKSIRRILQVNKEMKLEDLCRLNTTVNEYQLKEQNELTNILSEDWDDDKYLRKKFCINGNSRKIKNEILNLLPSDWLRDTTQSLPNQIPNTTRDIFVKSVKVKDDNNDKTTTIDLNQQYTLLNHHHLKDHKNYINQDLDEYVIYTDGSVQNDGSAGYGIYVDLPVEKVGIALNESLIKTINNVELLAILNALKIVPTNKKVTIKSDSAVSISIWKALDYSNNPLLFFGKAFYNTVLELRKIKNERDKHGKGNTIIEKVKAHMGVMGNELADYLANKGTKEESYCAISPLIYITEKENKVVPSTRVHTKQQTQILHKKALAKLEHQGEIYANGEQFIDKKQYLEVQSEIPMNQRTMLKKMILNNGPWKKTMFNMNHENVPDDKCRDCITRYEQIEDIKHILFCDYEEEARSNLNEQLAGLLKAKIGTTSCNTRYKTIESFNWWTNLHDTRDIQNPIFNTRDKYRDIIAAMGIPTIGLLNFLKTEIGLAEGAAKELIKTCSLIIIDFNFNNILQRIERRRAEELIEIERRKHTEEHALRDATDTTFGPLSFLD